MSSELGVSSEPKHPIVPPPPLNIGDLPQDLLRQIFCRLSPRDLQAAALASRGMNCSVKEAAHFNEFHSLKNFIRTLIQKLPEQKERLVEIAQNRVFQNFANLQQLKEYILDVKAQLIGVIKTVDAETANSLHDVQPPHFLEDIFTLAAFERQIDEAHLIPDENERGFALWNISTALTRKGDIDRSLEVATSIPGKDIRMGALVEISKALTRKGNIDRSLEVVWLIPDEGTRGEVFGEISKALKQARNIKRAIAVAKLISNSYKREKALEGMHEFTDGCYYIDPHQ